MARARRRRNPARTSGSSEIHRLGQPRSRASTYPGSTSVNIEPASRLAPVSPAPAPSHPVSWIVGSVHPAHVLGRYPDGRVALRVDDEELLAEAPPDKVLPHAFRVRVTRAGTKPELELIRDESDDDEAARTRALLALIPRQAGLAGLLAELHAVHAAPDTAIPAQIQPVLAQLNAAMASASDFSDAASVLQALHSSGMSMEARLLRAIQENRNLSLSGDWKASLLRLTAALSHYPPAAPVDSRSDLQPPQPDRELPRQPRAPRVPWRGNASDWGRLHHAAQGVIARQTIAQLQSGAKSPTWQFEIPMHGRGGLDVLQIRFAPTTTGAGNEPGWLIQVAIDFPALGAIGAEIRIVENRVRVQFWAEISAVARRIESSLTTITDRLQRQGLVVEHAACRYGRPEPSPGASGGLVSATA